MKGNILKCDLTPKEKDYDYKSTVKDLENTYGFHQIGEGGFGIILNSGSCVIKVIKDISRCKELAKEREVYERIQEFEKKNQDIAYPEAHVFPNKLNKFMAQFPKYHLYNELDNFCHFNMQKIWSPLSGFGDLYDDEEYGHGFVVTQTENKVLLIENGKKKVLKSEEVYCIDKPGNLIHFYINHFDIDLKEKLDNHQGILVGKRNLENMFGIEMVRIYVEAIGELLAFLIFDLQVIPNDIEIVLGTQSNEDRVVIPFIYDFNECDFYQLNRTAEADKNHISLNDNILFRLAKSLYNKNGRFYFPNSQNEYYPYFQKGFLRDSAFTIEKKKLLDAYSSLFK